MTKFGILERRNFAEIPPRVEYKLTAIGQRLIEILKSVEALEHEIETQKNR